MNRVVCDGEIQFKGKSWRYDGFLDSWMTGPEEDYELAEGETLDLLWRESRRIAQSKEFDSLSQIIDVFESYGEPVQSRFLAYLNDRYRVGGSR